ncbi:MAG: flagellar hook-length control protein FliK, partial [Xanthobacteraceae bacterium]
MKAVTANLPAFGLLTTNSATTQATAAASSTSSAAVSIAGLPIAIAARVQAGSNQFDIRLDPPELGRIDVRLDVDSNGQVTSLVTVDRPETLTLLQSHQPQLERALQQAGLKTADN